MFKIAISHPRFFLKIIRTPILRNFFVYKTSSIDAIADPVLHSDVVSFFRTESFHGKTTGSKRFADVDPIAARYAGSFSNPAIHDIAVSTGITSCELLDELRIKNIRSRFYISDKYWAYYYTDGPVVRVFSTDKSLVYGYFFFILADRYVSNFFPISKILYFLIARFSSFPENPKRVVLFDPKTKGYLEEKSLMRIEFDVFRTILNEEFEFVRCMNLLNLNSWFNTDQIEMGLFNILDSLKENGILQIGRTDDYSGINRVGFYKKVNGVFKLMEEINGGSELHSIIESTITNKTQL